MLHHATDPGRPAILASVRRAHRALRARVDGATRLGDAALEKAFPTLVAAVEAAFRGEEDAMEMLNDPRLPDRRWDNAVILCALHRVACAVERGDVALGRTVLQGLGDVLELHRIWAACAARPAVRSGAPGRRPPRITARSARRAQRPPATAPGLPR